MAEQDPFEKTDPQRREGFLEAEAAGLAWLRAAGPGSARVVEVVAASADRLVLERLRPGRPTAADAAAFGAALARTHAAGARAFGARPEGYAGPLYIGNRRMPAIEDVSWGVVYARGGVLPFLEPARAAGALTGAEEDLVRRACDRLLAGDFDDDEPPARLHGDLWAGNVVWTAEGGVLIDPAAHGGHRETDLAMLALFGAPYLERILAAYDEAAPLRAGWHARVPLHQLHPLAVHAAGHGRGYGVELAAAAEAVLTLPAPGRGRA